MECKHPNVARVVVGSVAVLCLTAIVVVAILRDRITNVPQWQINVAGQGKVVYQPDIATVNVGVQLDKEAKAEDALNKLNARINAIIKALKEAGIQTEDIQTQNLSLMPHYDFVDNQNKQNGFDANQQITVKVRDIKEGQGSLSKVIAAANKAGANQVNSVVFEASNINELKQEARLKAIADAKKKAGPLADAMGVRLGEVVGWWENFPMAESGAIYDGKGGMGGAMSNVSSVPSGQRELNIEVNLNYKLK